MTAISKEKKPIFQEENGFYEIDCTKAVWATNEIHALYQQAGFYRDHGERTPTDVVGGG